MTKEQQDDFVIDPEHIHFIPLGGSEQFGVNLNLYTYKNKYLAIDCGIGFADHRFPGVDILLPDPSYLEAHKKNLVGLIITHAHEDHIGAVAYLWPELRCPIYCTAFTAAILKEKFNEAPECKDAEIYVVSPMEIVTLQPFNVQFVPVSHSIPDTCALFVETDKGTIVHSGDWNLDPCPVVGPVTDPKTFQELGKKNVLAYVGDSTNAGVAGRSGSESDAAKGLEKVFKECKGRVVVTMFASNVGRVRSVMKAAEKTNRYVSVIGRSLHTMTRIGQECGYMDGLHDVLSNDEIEHLEAEKQVYIVTGSQGEARAALARIARGDHPALKLGRGDSVVFSARAIPGNEKEINHIKNQLSAAGVQIITPDNTNHCIHVSGHPYQDEIVDMLGWTKPTTVIPVHGERTQLEAHAELAQKCQIKNTLVPQNGSVIRIDQDGAEQIGVIETGILAVEPQRIIAADHQAIVARRKLQYTGAVHITLVIDARGDLVAEPQITCLGLTDPDDPDDQKFEKDLLAEVKDTLADMEQDDRYDDHIVHEDVRIAVRRLVHYALGMKAKVTVHLIRI